MAHIRDIDIDKVLIDLEFKPFLAQALIELDELFDENGWDKFLTKAHIEEFYEYSIHEFEDGESENKGGEVDFEIKSIKLKDLKDVQTLKHELLHAIKGEKIISGVKHQGVKTITPNSKDKYETGRTLEEYLNELMAGGNGNFAYRDGTSITKLLYAIVGDDLIQASLNNNRTQLEDIFYNITGSDEFLKIFESRLSLIDTANKDSNEVYMLSPAVILIDLYTQMREKSLKNINLTKADAIKMLEKDEQIRTILKELDFENLSKICLNIFNKKISDLYKSEDIYELDYATSIEFEKSSKLIDKTDLSFVDYDYEDSALNGGDILRKTYELQIASKIENNGFPNTEYGLRSFIETMRHFQKDIAIPIEENKQKQELIELDIPTFETDSIQSEENAFSNKRYKKLFAKMSERLFGVVDEEFIQKLSNPSLISDTEISLQNLEKKIVYFAQDIKINSNYEK